MRVKEEGVAGCGLGGDWYGVVSGSVGWVQVCGKYYCIRSVWGPAVVS